MCEDVASFLLNQRRNLNSSEGQLKPKIFGNMKWMVSTQISKDEAMSES